MSLRKLEGGGAACAYCGFALVMEGERQCCPAGRDYDALQRECEEAKEYGTRMRREWQRECEDTDLLLQGLGLCPSEYRSEGGSLLLGRIQHVINKRKAGIVAERDEAVRLCEVHKEDAMREIAEANELAARADEAVALLREESYEQYRFTQMTEYPSVTRMLLWHMDRRRRIDDFLAKHKEQQ